MKQQIMKLTLMIFIVCMALYTVSYAEVADSFNLTLQANKTALKKGDTAQISIVLDNIEVESGDKGIGAYSAKISYDTNIFGEIENLKSENWEIMQNEGSIIANTKDGNCVTQKTVTCTFELKVKENAEIGETSIKIEEIKGSSGETVIGQGNELKIKIEEKLNDEDEENKPNTGDEENKPNTGDEANKPNENNPSDNKEDNKPNTKPKDENNTNNKPQNNQSENLTKDAKLPQTGEGYIVGIILAISIISSIVLYIKYKKAY